MLGYTSKANLHLAAVSSLILSSLFASSASAGESAPAAGDPGEIFSETHPRTVAGVSDSPYVGVVPSFGDVLLSVGVRFTYKDDGISDSSSTRSISASGWVWST